MVAKDAAQGAYEVYEVLSKRATRCGEKRCNHGFSGPHGYLTDTSCIGVLQRALPAYSYNQLTKWNQVLGWLGLRKTPRRHTHYIDLGEVSLESIQAGLAALRA